MLNKEKPLDGKKILFFAPAFFNYEGIIRDRMEELGAEAYLYDERSVKSAFLRALNKVVPTWFNKYSHNYFHQIINKHKGIEFDYVIVIKSDMMPVMTLEEIKKVFHTAKLVLYLYDSITDIPGIEAKFCYYDRILTFDRKDAIENSLVFRPLFFSDDYIARKNTQQYNYDLAFMGTIHTDRFRILKKIISQTQKNGWKAYWFFYLQAEFMFYWYWITKHEYKLNDRKYFSMEKKSGREIASIVEQTKAIVDIESPGQKGLTMRTIEMVGLKKKLITTNQDIVNYDFYNPNNISVIDRANPIISKEFIKTPYRDVPVDIYWRYHLDSWIMDVINNN